MLKKIFICLLLFLGLLIRLYKIDSPIADWHSFRQADTSSVTRNFVNYGINILNPTYHDLSDIQSGTVNPKGYRLVELPIYNAISALTYRFTNLFGISLEVNERLVSIFCSLASALLIYLIVKKISKNSLSAFFALSTFLFLPFNIFYSRTILPEPMAVLFMLLSLYFILHQKFILAGFPLALAILVKPYTALLLSPIIIYYFFHKPARLNGFAFGGLYFLNNKSILKILIFGLISILPFIAWRLWISRHPEGIPVSDWLFNGGGIRFRPAWFRWLFDERIAKLILGTFGIIPLFLGFAYKKDNYQKIVISLFAGILLYFSIIARGNVQHDYYQVLIIPFLSIIIGVGLYYIFNYVFSHKFYGFISIVIILTFSLSFSAYKVIEYYKINNPIIMTAGAYVNQTLPKNAVIIAPYTGDTAFLYQTNRPGWPTEVYDVPKIKAIVAPRPLYLVSVNFDTYTNMMISKFPILYKNDYFVILNLN